jgi:hypothetical protein
MRLRVHRGVESAACRQSGLGGIIYAWERSDSMNAHAKEQLVELLLSTPSILDELRFDLDSVHTIFVEAVNDAIAEQELLAEMISYRENVTGIHNTLLIS